MLYPLKNTPTKIINVKPIVKMIMNMTVVVRIEVEDKKWEKVIKDPDMLKSQAFSNLLSKNTTLSTTSLTKRKSLIN